ncbi:MAG: hypothetical protein F4W96_03030 [Chloroflexi bacterium]|nr:hypothetical protein [Chloroflexota bacterium]
MLPSANLRFRLRTIEVLDGRRCPWLKLVLSDSEHHSRRSVLTMAYPYLRETPFVACGSELIARGVRNLVLQQGGYGVLNPPTVAPDAPLLSILTWTTRRVAAYAGEGWSPARNPDALYRPDVRGTGPRLAAELSSLLGDDAPTVRVQIAVDLTNATLMARSCVINIEAVYVGVR